MKTIIWILVLLIELQLVAQDNEVGLVFEEESYDFGSVLAGDKVSHTFRFINKSTREIRIENVITSCGCTASEWPQKSIKPADIGTIKVLFDSEGKLGDQKKVITVITNHSKQQYQLNVSAHVLPRRSPF